MRHKRIPGKKRKGHKDLDARLEERERSMSGKVNAQPSNPDDQEIPRKLREMMKAKERLNPKSGKLPNHKKNKPKPEIYRGKKLLDSTLTMGTEMKLKGMTRPLKPVPVFKQMPGEAKKQFFRRMDKTVNAVLERKKYEDKYDVDVVDNPETGQTTVKDREKDELDLEVEKKKAKSEKKKGRIVAKSKEEKRQIRRAKEKERKTKQKRGGTSKASKQERPAKSDGDGDNEPVKEFKGKDSVKFNEVAHAPPTKLAGVSKNLAERRPGQKTNLLLTQKLNKQQQKPKKETVSLARKKVLEDERQKVIEQYRKIREEKYEQANKKRL